MRRAPALAAAAALALAAAAAAPGAARAGAYRWPTTFGAVVTAHYDNNGGAGAPLDWLCGGNSYSGHRGTDVGVPKFTDVFAGADGWVKQSVDGYGDGYLGSTDGGGFGNHVAIHHGGGDLTIYAHLAGGTGLPAKGATVTCGQKIGQSGASGNSSGPHLHFETRVGVDEMGSYYSGAADDPYAGPCSGPITFWVDQNGGKPTTDCAAAPPPPDPCAGLPPEGECLGDLLRRCEGGALVETDCAADGRACAFSDDAGVHACLDAPDGDGDGAPAPADCDDADPSVHPGAAETCNGIDDDCSGAADEELVRMCGCGVGAETCVAGAWSGCADACPSDAPEPPALVGSCAAAPTLLAPALGAPGLVVAALLALVARGGRRHRRRDGQKRPSRIGTLYSR